MKYILGPVKIAFIFLAKLLIATIISFCYIVLNSWIWHLSFSKIKHEDTTETYGEWWKSFVDFIKD